jgi:hypothetical protein
MFVFTLIFVASFIVAFREVLKGRRDGILTFIILGLSMYTTAMSVTYTLGLKLLIPVFQYFKEILVLCTLALNIVSLRYRPRFHLIDYAIFSFLALTLIYALLPIGEQSFMQRLLAFKSTSFYIVVYFTGRLMDPQSVFISKYFNYLILLTIAAGVVLLSEIALNRHLQTLTGYAEYVYYFFNFEPTGSYGLSTTFESDSGHKRFASFFANPLEHAAATLLALSVILALYTDAKNKFKPTSMGMAALGASLLSIIFALSRAPLAAYFLIIYVYALVTNHKIISRTFHIDGLCVVAYIAYLFSDSTRRSNPLIQVLMNTIDFTDPSSVGHVVEWVAGINAMIQNPMGLGLGASGRVAGTLGENVGGENQFIIIGVQAGVAALLLYLCIYVMFIRTGIKGLRYLEGKERQVCLAVLLMKVGFLIPLFTSEVESSSYISYMNWFLSGLLISIIMRPRSETRALPAND